MHLNSFKLLLKGSSVKKQKSLSSVTQADEYDLTLDRSTTPLVKWIKSKWNWKGLKPKGMKKFLESYDAYTECKDVDTSKFKGFLDDNAIAFPFPEATSINQVAFDKIDQDRDELHTLISACVGYGMCVMMARQKLTNDKVLKELNEKIKLFVYATALDVGNSESIKDAAESVKYLSECLKISEFDLKG